MTSTPTALAEGAHRTLIACLLVSVSVTVSAATVPFAVPAAKHEVRLEKSIMVPMRDGVRLSTDLYLPQGIEGRVPAILVRTPYGKNSWRKEDGDGGLSAVSKPAYFFTGQGFAVVVQDLRGRYESEGTFVFLGGDRKDGVDTLAWIAAQPWSNGKVGMYGCSYLGEVQYQLATQRDPRLAAIVPQGASAARYRGGSVVTGGTIELNSVVVWFRDYGSKLHYLPQTGTSREAFLDTAAYFRSQPALPKADYEKVFRSLPVIDMLKLAGSTPTDFEELIKSLPPPTDLDGREVGEFAHSWWRKTDYLKHDERYDVPALHINGWYDFGTEETLNILNLMRTNAASARGRDNQFAIVGPTTHCGSEEAAEPTVVGEREFRNASLDYFDIYLRWFAHWLTGADNGVTKMPKLQLFIMGRDEWRGENEWPLARTRFTKYYLSSNGKANGRFGDGLLSPSLPKGQPSDTYVYDPKTPVPTVGGLSPQSSFLNQGAFDQSEVEMRQDVLVYATPALQKGVEVTGSIEAVLYVSSSAKDTDFTAKLVDVFPDGRAFNVQEGVLRARYREGFDRKVWMRPGEVYEVRVDLNATANYFAPGHRIRLEVSSSNFPRYDRNLNTGGNNYDETRGVVAHNVIHHTSQYPSHVLLPIIPSEEVKPPEDQAARLQ